MSHPSKKNKIIGKLFQESKQNPIQELVVQESVTQEKVITENSFIEVQKPKVTETAPWAQTDAARNAASICHMFMRNVPTNFHCINR